MSSEEYADFKRLCIIDVKHSWTAKGYLLLPLKTLQRGYLAMIPEGLARDMWRCNGKTLRMDTVRPGPWRVGGG